MLEIISKAKQFYRRGLKQFSRRKSKEFKGSKRYWDERYKFGGNSGDGSYGLLAEFKADIINNFVVENKIQTIIEFGYGDGNQFKISQLPRILRF